MIEKIVGIYFSLNFFFEQTITIIIYYSKNKL